ncbi:MAG: DUF3311 domain-containing protein [Xanthobacteraceae bacterium]
MSSSSDPAKITIANKGAPRRRLSWLLIIPVIAIIFPQLFNYREPAIAGVPFFYWYLLLWIPLTAFLTWVVYRQGPADPSKGS